MLWHKFSIFIGLLLMTYCQSRQHISKIDDGRAAPATTSKPNKRQSDQLCRTPSGELGKCQDISSCPYVLLDLTNIGRYLCFRNYFFPGICCPRRLPISSGAGNVTSAAASTIKITTLTTTTRPPTGIPALFTTNEPNDSNFAVSAAARDGCGKNNVITTRVVGGDESVAGQWPWMVAIYLQRRGKEYWCGGALINPNYVLTASHCVHDSRQKKYRPSLLTVRIGDNNLLSSEDDLEEKPIDLKVTEVITHANFRLQTYYNDIALLKLDKTVAYSDYIRPICLPTDGLLSEDLMGQFATVVGWGATTFGGSESGILRFTEVPIWDNVDCDRVYKQDIERIYLCAGLADGGKDACQGDSGSPLMVNQNGRWTIIGIVSFGTRCAEPGFPGVYTRITEYLGWIADHTK